MRRMNMRYYKTVTGGIVESISTVNSDGDGNITAAEFAEIKTMFQNMPDGKQIKDNGDGTYAYVDAPAPEPSEDVDDSEALEILLGGAE